MVDDAERVPGSFPHLADPMPQRDPEKSPGSLCWSVTCGKKYSVSLVCGKHLNPRLRARHILHQHKLSALPVATLLAKHHNQLERKRNFAVQILMQAVVASGF